MVQFFMPHSVVMHKNTLQHFQEVIAPGNAPPPLTYACERPWGPHGDKSPITGRKG